jgi:hypothetical protein
MISSVYNGNYYVLEDNSLTCEISIFSSLGSVSFSAQPDAQPAHEPQPLALAIRTNPSDSQSGNRDTTTSRSTPNRNARFETETIRTLSNIFFASSSIIVNPFFIHYDGVCENTIKASNVAGVLGF